MGFHSTVDSSVSFLSGNLVNLSLVDFHGAAASGEVVSLEALGSFRGTKETLTLTGFKTLLGLRVTGTRSGL